MATVITGAAAIAGTAITLPGHAADDLIMMVSWCNNATTLPTVPGAAGTVPAWTMLLAPNGSSSCAYRIDYATATAGNHTSGTWTGATGLAAVVLRGADTAKPMKTGGSAGSGSNNVPNYGMSSLLTDDGSSALLYIYMHRTVTAWGAVPAGFTRQAQAPTQLCINSRDDTTSAPSAPQPCTTTSSSAYRGLTIEIQAVAGKPPAPGFFFMF